MRQHFYLLSLFSTFFITHAIRAQTNVALGKTVTATSGTNLSNLVNGNFNDGANSATTGNAQAPPNAEWFQIDLGADYFIDSIVLVANTTSTATENRGRRFMITTQSTDLSFPSAQPSAYIGENRINRLIYTAPIASGSLPFGTSSTVPQAVDVNLGPQFPLEGTNRVLRLNIGIHKARYVRILTLQDEALTFGEVQVFTTTTEPVRYFTNGNFEIGSNITTGVQFVAEGLVAGWSTTEPVGMWDASVSAPIHGTPVEFWRGGSNPAGNVPAHGGNYFVELNAHSSGMLVQEPICLLPGETFTWSFAHRGRSGVDRMALTINYIDVAMFDDNNAVTGTHDIVAGSVLAGTTATKVSTDANGWTLYSGTWTNPSSSASNVVTFGFRAVSTSGGSLSVGNFLDNIQIQTASSVATFEGASKSGLETVPTAALPKLQLSGNVSTPSSVQLHFVGGTATRGVDYITTPATGFITIPVPVGNYDGTDATGISLAPYIQIVADNVTESNETIIMEVLNPTGNIIAPNTAGSFCQTLHGQITYTIIDHIALPVTLGDLEAVKTGVNTIDLKWKTFSEQNNTGFGIERSADGISWTQIGFVPTAAPQGNSQVSLQYAFTDNNILNGTSYYRLKQIDIDGQYSYSDIAKTGATGGVKLLSAYPNPVTNKLILKSGRRQDIAGISLMDFSGKTVLQLQGFRPEIDMSGFLTGIYIIKVTAKNGETQTFKIKKQ
ncbi:T9SS type A sorting domain-containing protein [Terrimonas rubra]|uniref:T9SS type A sorting domain-containing protein n=1 Tax=Terrimonas rubra TaxID=1035890 RepID=A0ABW6A399_9BACT